MKKADPVLNYEEFSHLCYNVVKIEKADLPSGGSDGSCAVCCVCAVGVCCVCAVCVCCVVPRRLHRA